MKRWLICILVLLSSVTYGQVADTSQPYYKRFPTVTPFQILLSDSSTIYTRSHLPKNTPVAFLVFSPDCNHCQHEAEEIYSHREALKGIQIVMITMHSFESMKNFISKYKLNELSNVVVGRDIYYLMPAYYNFHNLPFHALYNKEGRLLSVFEGEMNINTLIMVLKD